MARFRFRLEQVLDHRTRREDLMKQELARAMAAVALQQEKAVTAERAVESALAEMRALMDGSVELDRLRAGHDALAMMRARAAHERATVETRLEPIHERSCLPALGSPP